MQRFGWGLRIARIALVAVAAWLTFRWLDPLGYGWTVPVVAGALVLFWVGVRAYRIMGARAEDARSERWATALMSPPHRPEVIDELHAAVGAIDPGKNARAASEHARLTLVLAELLEADGHAETATEVLAEVREDALSERLAGVVRHARAVAALSAGEPDRAASALDELPGPTGDAAVDLRVRLLRGLIDVERGAPERALEVAEDARDEVGDDRELMIEVRVLEAVALEASGDDEAAVTAMARVGDDMLEVLLLLGLPRVRALAARTRDSL